MKVVIIAGSLPPQVCGVGDFTGALIHALRRRNLAVAVMHRNRWCLRDVPGLLRNLRAERPDIVHLQYPTHGFRRSLVPHLLHLGMSGWPRLTTLHDYAGQRWQIRLGMSVFTIGGSLIVTGALDRDALVGRHPWLASRVSVVPIGSNVPSGLWEPSGPFTIVHFGMLRPGKGIEQMIHLARLCKQLGRPYRAVIMGAVIPHGRDYADTLFKMAEDSGVEWMLNVSQERASEILRHAHVAYLSPLFGVQERRGTVLACAANGLPIVAKVDWETPAFLRDHVVAAASPQEALAAVDALAGAGTGPGCLREQSARSVALAKMFSWDTIADRYIEAMEIATSRGVRRGMDAGEVAGINAEIGVR